MEEVVGRETELQAIQEALARPGPAGIVLEGEAGIGKTAVWEAGVSIASARGMRVLIARPAEAETSLSHAALGDLLAPVVDELPAGFPEPQRRALDVALLRVPAQSGTLDPRAVGAAALGALRTAAEGGPVIVAVDDIQWLDAASAAALHFALRRLEPSDEIILLATRRSGEPLAAPLDTGLAEERLARIQVGPLDARALGRLVRSRVGDAIEPAALARVTGVAGGNPYFALELGRASLRQADGARLPLPDAIAAALNDRLDALPLDTRDALGCVAAMGHPTVSAAAGAVEPGMLDPAFEAGVLREDGDHIRFDHPLLAEAARRRLPPARRRALHLSLAEAATDAEERAHHLAAGAVELDPGMAAAIERGAVVAAERGALVAAAELLEESARLEPELEKRARRRISAIGHYMLARQNERGEAVGRQLLDELPAGPLRARALTAVAQLEGDLPEMVRYLEQAVDEAGDDRDAKIHALYWLAYMLEFAGREDEGYEALLSAMELSTPDDPRVLRVMLATAHGHFAHLRGDPEATELMRHAAELEGDEFIPSAGWGAGTLLARALLYADELEPARRLLEDRYARVAVIGDDESRTTLAVFLTALELRAGDLRAALRYADECAALQQSVSSARALVAAYMGDVKLAREQAEAGLVSNEARGDSVLAAANRATLGFLEFSLGDHAAALRHLQPLIDRFLSRDAGDPGIRQNIGVPDAIEALTSLGRLDEAEALLVAWEEAGERFDRPRIHATAARCRALLAAGRGDLDAAIAHAEAALDHHAELPVPFERARTLIVLGTLHRRAKHKAAARAALEEALAILEDIGVPLWAERARAELGRIGGRAKADGLTPTEERVADLVADGLSNKQVAAELFVSVRTVEANLTRVYSKLRIRSRTELAAIRQASDGRSRSPARPPAQRS